MSTEPRETLFEGSLEDCLFVIFTNAKGNENLGEKRCEDFSQAEEFLCSGSGSIFRLDKDEDMLKCLGDCGDDGKQFLKHLRVFCGQPSGEQLKVAVKEELGKMDKSKIKGWNIDRICECFSGNVKVWWEKRGKKNDILHKGDNILESALESVRLESELVEIKTRLLTTSEHTLKEFGLSLEFEATAIKEFANRPVSHVVSSEGTSRLTLTKLCQASEGRTLLLKIEHLITNKRGLLAECLHGNVKQLVVFAGKGWPSEHSEECFEIVNEIVKRHDTFSLVFLSDRNNSQVSALTAMLPGECETNADNFKFSQLKEVSRNDILEKAVNLQGHDTTLGELLSQDCESLDQVLNASLVADILGSVGPLTVGSALSDGIGYYVERTLEQALCVKASVFQDLQGTVTIRITSSEASARGLLEKALEFLSSNNDSPSLNHGNIRDVINKLKPLRMNENDHPDENYGQGFIGSSFQSLDYVNMRDIIIKFAQTPLDPDVNDCGVFIGQNFQLGLYECNFVGLRCGQENKVTALRVRLNKGASQQVSVLFVDMETNDDDVRKLSEFHEVRHLFDLRDGHLHWIRSHQDFESIRKHVDEDLEISSFAPESAMDVEDRLMLVCAEPGMGKSTLMARLAKNTKAALPHYFVIFFALNDHTKLFAKSKHTEVLEFLSIAAKMESPLQRSLLKFALEVSGNVVVIADGFDEIAPRYIKECCHLLSRLLEETKARKIWMTSRNSVKQTIETHFSKFSAKLRAFHKESQKKFFQTYWGKKSKVNEIELDKFIDDLLKKSSKAIQDEEKNFLGVPLQCQMLAEVFEDQVDGSAKNAKLPDKLDLFSLLEMFVDKKCKVYVENKLKISFDDTNYEDHFDDSRKKFIDSHSKAGLLLILGEDGLKTLGMEQIINDSLSFCKEIQLGKDKTGFIDEIVNDKPRFIHRVFAEYFVAYWISQHLADSAELIKSKMFTADFAVIRHIFNGLMCKGFVLHTAVLQENKDEVKALLESEDVETQDGGGRTALHLAAGLGTSEDREENNRRGEVLNLIIGETSDFKVVDKVLCASPLGYADITRTWAAIDKLLCKTDDNGELGLTLGNVRDDNMLDTIFQQDLDKLLGLCLDNGLPVEHRYGSKRRRLLVMACLEGSLKVASLLIERNADVNKTDNDDNDISPLIASSRNGHLEIVKLLVQKCVSSASPSHSEEPGHETNYQEPSKYINMQTQDGKTAIHYAAMEGHEDVIRYLIGQGGDAQSLDSDNRTPLHFAAMYFRSNAMRVLLQAWDEPDRAAAVNSCDKREDSVLVSTARRYHANREGMSLQEYIDLKDKDGNTVMHYAAIGSVECIILLLQAGRTLTEDGFHGQTPLMIAAVNGKQEVVKWMLDNFIVEKEGKTMQKYIDSKDKEGHTVMHYAAWGGSVECIKHLLQFGRRLTEKGWNKQTPLMTAAFNGKQEVVKWMLDNFNVEKEGMTLQEYIDLKDKNGDTVMHLAAWGGSVECIKHLLQFGRRLTEEGWNGQTPLTTAAFNGKQEVVKWMLENFNVEKEGMTLQEYIDLKVNYGNTVMHIAAVGGSVECIKLFLLFGRRLTEEGWNGQTPLMQATRFGKQEVVKWLLDNFNSDREGMTLQEYIDLKDKDGDTVINHAAKGGSVECIKLLLQTGGTLSGKGLYDETPLMRAAGEGKQEVVKWIMDNFNADREGMSLQEYIDLKDKDGNTVMHLASKGGSLECIKLLLQFGSSLSEKGFNGQTPLMRAAVNFQQEVVKWLLDNFNPDREGMTLKEYIGLKTKNGNTVMHLAAYGGSVECIKPLLQFGMKLTEEGWNGQTPLMTAVEQGKHEVVKWLLDNFNVDREGMTLQEYINLTDEDGDTVINHAAVGGSVECITLLLQFGGTLSEKGLYDETLLMKAARAGKQEVVKWILDYFNVDCEGMTLQEYIDLKDKNGDTVMHLAAWGGSVECINLLLRFGSKMTGEGFKGQTPLMRAALFGKQEVVKWLLDNFNADREGMTLQEYIDLTDEDGDTVMHSAANGGFTSTFTPLLQAGGKFSVVGFNGQSVLMTAVKEGRQIFEWLMANFNADREGMTLQENIDLKNTDGDTVIHLAALGSSVYFMNCLVKVGGKLSVIGFNGQTPLMIAAREGRLEVVTWLLDNFCAEKEGMTLQEYIDLKDMDGDTVMHLAALKGSLECIKLLVKAGAKLSQLGLNGETLLVTAASDEKLQVVKWVLDNFNAEKEGMTLQEYIDLKDKDGDTVMHLAAWGCSLRFLKCLVKVGGKLSQLGFNGETPLVTAAKEGRQEVVKWLLENFNSDREGMTLQEYIDLKDKDGNNVMHYAGSKCSLLLVKLLLESAGMLPQVDSNGQTPLMIAARFGKQEVVQWLIDNFNADMEGMTLQQYIDLKDKDDRTVLYWAGT